MFLLFFQHLAAQLFGARAMAKTNAVASSTARVLQRGSVGSSTVAIGSAGCTVSLRGSADSDGSQLFRATVIVSIATSQ